MSVGGCPSDTHTIPAGENQKKTFCTEFNIFRQRGWRRGRRVGGVGAFSVFFLSLIFTQSEVWTHLEAEQTGAAAKAARHINASFSFFLSVGKVEINQCDRVKGIRTRWEVEITCYYPFGKLQQSDINIIHKAFCWVYPLTSSLFLTLHLCQVCHYLVCLFDLYVSLHSGNGNLTNHFPAAELLLR